MLARRPLTCVLLLAAAFHLVGMVFNPLPAQDGLKFIRFARQFQSLPWADVVRGADQHPLYPASIALVQPVIAIGTGPNHHSWRIAAQAVSSIASIALLVPLFLLVREWFDQRTAALSALLFVLLPVPGDLGHDTLSDPLALLGFTTAFWLGVRALKSGRLTEALGCGIASGLGFLARPEVALLPVVVGLLAFVRWFLNRPTIPGSALGNNINIPALLLCFLTIVGTYALIKGDVSEKLALQHATGLGSGPKLVRTTPIWLPKGLDDPRWDFSPKEEWDHPQGLSATSAGLRLARRWSEGLAWGLVPFVVWGAWRSWKGSLSDGIAIAYVIVFSAVLVRHAMGLGYLSSRHTLSLLIITIPWAASGILLVGDRLSTRLGGNQKTLRQLSFGALAASVVLSAMIQCKPGHPSRWGHLQAGHWLAEHARSNEAVLDTRGWAAFVSGRNSFDYWHVRQALTDPTLAYVVVTDAELKAPTPRAETLRAVLDHSSTLAVTYPERREGRGAGVLVYRFQPPESWEELLP
ncbi:hypothetical protein BH23PLA1_BH23PLA1_27160 [soil metagenome]